MKTAFIATIATAVSAAASDFPSLDSLHASCTLTFNVASSCADVYTALDTTAKALTPGSDVSGGIYAIKEETANDYIWVTRTTPVKQYVDDIMFTVSGTGDACTIQTKSRSETLSYYDYDTNYCNQYNMFRYSGLTFAAPKLDSCKWAPAAADIDTTCNTY